MKTFTTTSKLIALVLMGAVATSAFGQGKSTYEGGFTVLRDDIRYEVHADGTYTNDEIESMRINNEQGIKILGQISLPFSSSLQDLEVIEAYTVDKSGKRIEVEKDKIFVQQSPASQKAPMFDDAKVKNVVFPGVEIGATVNLHFRRTQKKPLFPDAFSMIEHFDKTIEFKAAQVTVTAPESMTLYVETADLSGGEVKAEQSGTKMWRWNLADTVAHAPEPGSVSAIDFSPRVAITSFASYPDVAKAYLDRATSKAQVTPEVQKLADDITKGIGDKRAQAEALYKWVSKNIRYVAIFLDFGGVVPHDANAIIAAKYGDCKDHVTLLEALLSAKQINSSPVLVNGTDGFWLPKIALAPGVMNHVMTYLPEFDLYVDSTAEMAPFGVLSPTEAGKTALLTRTDTSAQLVTLPASQANIPNAIKVQTQLIVAPNGDLKGTSQVTNTGIFEFVARTLSSTVPKGMEPQAAAQLLSMSGQQGSGSYSFGDMHDLDQPFAYKSEFTLPSYAQTGGPGAMSTPVGLGSLTGLWSMVQGLSLEKRDFPRLCLSTVREETTEILLPESIKVSTLPNGVKVNSEIGSYQSTYSMGVTGITVKRELTLKLGPVCDSANYAKVREMAGTIAKDLRAQIIYQ